LLISICGRWAKDVYIQKVGWDIVVIDEAHRLRNVYKITNKIANAIHRNFIQRKRNKSSMTLCLNICKSQIFMLCHPASDKEIENKKDGLIDEIEKKLKQKISEEKLFTIRWKIV
jgi:hypothetical protein